MNDSGVDELRDGGHDLLLQQDGQDAFALPGPADDSLLLGAPALAHQLELDHLTQHRRHLAGKNDNCYKTDGQQMNETADLFKVLKISFNSS